MAGHSIRITDPAYENLEKLRYQGRLKSKRKIYNQEIIEFALDQINRCPTCIKKFQKWVIDNSKVTKK